MQRQLSPALLPIARYETQIMDLIDAAPVVVVSGKTGCGKSTQVPQYILKRHYQAKIVVCQPRRVAATSLAVRVSEELGCKLGSKVGYHIGMESFREEHCSIVYMTYGILIQQLLFMQNLPYTHILLDQIHERSLEMDFTFVTLKRIINGKYKQKIKLVVMSATLNADLFCQYFCNDSEGNFYISQLKEKRSKKEGRRGRGRNQEEDQEVELVPAGSEFKPALKLELQEERQFNVEEVFLDDLEQKDFYYGEDEQRISEEMYSFAVDLIKKQRKSQAGGDYLIFLPGLFQIRALKSLLISSGFSQTQIIQVHSLFSDQLYHSLFDASIKNKLILATNIGQSSITLPFCRVVIDFALTRKNSSKDRGVTRLQTRLTSQASMIQRSGRVGRVSDGTVYRLITRELYSKLTEYDKPEIQCVSLEMVILKVKQLDLMNQNEIFKNPYNFLMATINPPDIRDIRIALDTLITEEALVGQAEQSSSLKNADSLGLTEMGKFMVEMPCELRISKMMLMGLKIRIPVRIISIACILMLTKQFFLHEERRLNIEEFMHSLIGYDRGHFNDYLLRQNLFSHWREQFYEKAKEKKLFKRKKFLAKEESYFKSNHFQRIYESEEGAEEVLSFLQEFNQEKWSEREKQWCAVRGVSPNTMRELIRMQENVRLKVIAKNYQFLEKENTSNELVLLCLSYGFPDNDCEIKWGEMNQQVHSNSKESLFYLDLPSTFETGDDFLHDYIHPQKNYRLQATANKSKRIFGTPSILSKFILPKHFSKGESKSTSPLYQYLAKTNINHKFSSELHLRFRPIVILNESVCKSCIPHDTRKKYRLITHKFTEIGSKKLVGMGALVQEETFFMMQIILRKNVQLILHPSGEYFCGYKTSQGSNKIATVIDQDLLSDILFFRQQMSQKKQTKLTNAQQMMRAEDVSDLVYLLRAEGNRFQREHWEYRYQLDLNGKYQEQVFPINALPLLKKKSQYREKYKLWKLKKYEEFYRFYRPLLMDSIFIICRKCTHQIVEIEQISFFDQKTSILKLNEYSGSWTIAKGTDSLTCKYGHQVGKVLNQDEANIDRKSVQLYIPFNKIQDVWKSEEWKTQEEIEAMLVRGRQALNMEKNELDHLECIFCFQYIDSSGQCVLKTFQKSQIKQNYFKKFIDHMRSSPHLQRLAKFKENINLP